MRCVRCGGEIVRSAALCPFCGTPVEGTDECRDYAYEAFISYRHVDADRKLAKRLQRYLEHYRIPKRLASGRTEKRLGKLFRDQDELPTSSSLTKQIEDALRRSRYLIVVCSPESRESLWVQREVETFASLHGRGKIMLALSSGEPDESFPPLLLNRVEISDDGEQTLVPEEPLAADFREQGRSRSAFVREAARIAATLIGCGYDDLRQRQRQHTARMGALVASVVSAVSLAFGGFSQYQQVQISRERRAAQVHESEMLAVEAERLLERGDRYQAIQVALSALPHDGSERPYVPAAELMLNRAIGAYCSDGSWGGSYSLPLATNVKIAPGDFGGIAIENGAGSVEMRDLFFGDVVSSIELADYFDSDDPRDSGLLGMDFSGDNLVLGFDTRVACVDVIEGQEYWHVDCEPSILNLSVGDEVVAVIIASDDAEGDEAEDVRRAPSLVLYDVDSGAELQSFDLDEDIQPDTPMTFTVSEDGRIVALNLSSSRHTVLYDVDGNVTRLPIAGDILLDVVFRDDAWYMMSGEGVYGEIYVEAFDLSGELIWSYENTAIYSHDNNGMMDPTCGCLCMIEDGDMLGATYSTKLVMLDAKTGSERYLNVFHKPILGCCFEGNICFVFLSDGTMAGSTLGGIDSEVGFFYEDLTSDEPALVEFVRCQGMGLFAVARTIAPDKLCVFRMGDGYVAEMMGRPYELVPEGSTISWVGGLPCFVSSELVGFIDAESFALGATISTDMLPYLDWSVTPKARSTEDGAFVWGPAKDDPTDLALYRLANTGEVLGSLVVEDAVPVGSEGINDDLYERLSVASDGAIVVRADKRVLLVDQGKMRVMNEYRVNEGECIEGVICGPETVLMLVKSESSAAGRGRYVLLERNTGEEIASDFDAYAYSTSPQIFTDYGVAIRHLYRGDMHAEAVSADAQRVALACADGATRAFDLSDGHLLWESRELPAQPTFLAFMPEGDRLLVQDELGICSVASGDDGSLVASTMTSLPPISECLRVENGSALVKYGERGVPGEGGLALVSMSDDAFGPYADMPDGIAISSDSVTLLAGGSGGYVLSPIVDLDTSVTVAEMLVEEHPLTEAEAAYYQVDQR